jgi:hypothetical protein
MEIHSFHDSAFFSDPEIGLLFDLAFEQRQIRLGVPVEVQEDFMVDVTAHGRAPRGEARLKPALKLQ